MLKETKNELILLWPAWFQTSW